MAMQTRRYFAPAVLMGQLVRYTVTPVQRKIRAAILTSCELKLGLDAAVTYHPRYGAGNCRTVPGRSWVAHGRSAEEEGREGLESAHCHRIATDHTRIMQNAPSYTAVMWWQ